VSADAEGDAPPLDAARIIQVLAEHHVDYLVIGGLAARYHGAERATKDLDILTRAGPDNLDRLAAALRELARIYVSVASTMRPHEVCLL
jgi:hypothetical protein